MSAFGLFGGGKDVSSANTQAKAAAAPQNLFQRNRKPTAPAAPAAGGKQTLRSRMRGNRPVTGTAVPRSTVGDPTPPDTNAAAAANAANIAAQRVRRRGAGATVLTGLKSAVPSPGAKLAPRTLLGGKP